jgi:hypothetical protein
MDWSRTVVRNHREAHQSPHRQIVHEELKGILALNGVVEMLNVALVQRDPRIENRNTYSKQEKEK